MNCLILTRSLHHHGSDHHQYWNLKCCQDHLSSLFILPFAPYNWLLTFSIIWMYAFFIWTTGLIFFSIVSKEFTFFWWMAYAMNNKCWWRLAAWDIYITFLALANASHLGVGFYKLSLNLILLMQLAWLVYALVEILV